MEKAFLRELCALVFLLLSGKYGNEKDEKNFLKLLSINTCRLCDFPYLCMEGSDSAAYFFVKLCVVHGIMDTGMMKKRALLVSGVLLCQVPDSRT